MHVVVAGTPLGTIKALQGPTSGTGKKSYKIFVGWTQFFWKGPRGQHSDMTWFMDMRAQLRAVPSIQFTNTICTQLAADLVRQWLITTSTTGAAQQRVARKEMPKRALGRFSREANRQWENCQVQLTICLSKTSVDMRRKRPIYFLGVNEDGENDARLCSQRHNHVSEIHGSELLMWLFIWLLFILVMIGSWFLNSTLEWHLRIKWLMPPGL